MRFSSQILKKEEAIPWPGTLAIVHSYIAYKEGDSKRRPSPRRRTRQTLGSATNSLFLSAAKEEEKQKLMKWSSELKLEREQLELRVKQLSNSITVRNRRHFSIQSHSVRRESRCTKGLNASSLQRHSETPPVRCADPSRRHVHRAPFTVTPYMKVCKDKSLCFIPKNAKNNCLCL